MTFVYICAKFRVDIILVMLCAVKTKPLVKMGF